MTTGVSIVIPSWNGRELLKQFLSSVIAAASHYGKESQAPTEIVIVDDGSVDNTAEWLLGQQFADVTDGEPNAYSPEQAKKPQTVSSVDSVTHSSIDQPSPVLKLIRHQTNLGFGPACNRGFKAARHPLVFLLNNDVDVDVNAIAPLVRNFTDESVFSVHCRVYDVESGKECGSGKVGSFSNGFIRVHRSYVNLPASGSGKGIKSPEQLKRYSIFASGGSAMFDRRAFLGMGGFDGLLAPIYWEDVDISYRAWKRGLSVLYEPGSVVHHRVSSTMRKVNQRKLARLKQRNRLICHWVNLHDRTLMTSHFFWVILLALTAPLRLQPGFLLSVGSALMRIRQIRKRRLQEKTAAKRGDRDVFAIFTSLEQRPDVIAYDDYAELAAVLSEQPQ